MVRLLTVLLLCAPAEAGFGALIRAASKLGKAGKAAKVAKAGKLATVAGAAAVAERGGLVLARVGDEPGRVAAYVARQGDEVTMLSKQGDGIGAARLADDAQVDFYVDPTAGLVPDALPVREGARYQAVDAAGELHPLEQVDGVWVVDLGDGVELGLELGQFAAEQLLNGADGDDRTYWVVPMTRDCTATIVAAAGADLADASVLAQTDSKVLVIGDAVPDDIGSTALSQGHDLLALRVSDPCHGDVQRFIRDAQVEASLGHQAPLASLSTARQTVWHQEDPVHLEMTFAEAGVLASAEWVVHGVSAPDEEEMLEDPPAWFIGLCLLAGCAWAVHKYRRRE